MEKFLNIISALNDETRVKIVRFIDKYGEVCVCDIENSFNMIQSRISRHLKILKDAGFLDLKRSGRWAYYSIKKDIDKFQIFILKEISDRNILVPKLKKKKVLILCTGNSCRSIIAEALINKELKGIKAYSAGVKALGKVNENAKKVLKSNDAWRDEYHSKTIEKIQDIEFDLVVTVCDNAKESCPVFPKNIKTIHVGFSDPDGKGYEAFEKSFELIKNTLLPIVKKELKCS